MFPHFKSKLNSNSESSYQNSTCDKDFKSLYYKYKNKYLQLKAGSPNLNSSVVEENKNILEMNETLETYVNRLSDLQKEKNQLFNKCKVHNNKKNECYNDNDCYYNHYNKSCKPNFKTTNIKKIEERITNIKQEIKNKLNKEIEESESEMLRLINEKIKIVEVMENLKLELEDSNNSIAQNINKIDNNLIILNKELIDNISDRINTIKKIILEEEKRNNKNTGISDISESKTDNLYDDVIKDFEIIKDNEIISSIKFYKDYKENANEFNVNYISAHGTGIEYDINKYVKLPHNIILIFLTPINRYSISFPFDPLDKELKTYQKLINYGKDALNPYNFINATNKCMNSRQIILPGQYYFDINLKVDSELESDGLYDSPNLSKPSRSKYGLKPGVSIPLQNVLNLISDVNLNKKTIVYINSCRKCITDEIDIRFQVMLRERLLKEINFMVASEFKIQKNTLDEICNLQFETSREYGEEEANRRRYSAPSLTPNYNIYKVIAPIVTYKIDGDNLDEWKGEIIKTIEGAIASHRTSNPEVSFRLNLLMNDLIRVFKEKKWDIWKIFINNIKKFNKGINFSEEFEEFNFNLKKN